MTHELLPHRPEVSPHPRDDHTVRIDGEAANDVFAALSVGKRREMLDRLQEDAMTASQLASAVGTSVQNVIHHLETLQDADLIEVVDTWYSSRGKEMSVYAASVRSIVVTTGDG
jgi:DNA-binding transcriptional ArsR family regulator